MELRHLRYFIAVAEELHFGRAARRLGIAQPPLSQQIRRLEAELGAPLFSRASRRVQLTDVGRAFLGEAKATIAQSDRALRVVRRAVEGDIGRLVIGYVASTVVHSEFIQLVRTFREARPDVELVLEQLSTSQQVAALREQRIDVGFLRPPIADGDEGFAMLPIVREGFVIVLPAGHRLATRRPTSLADLAGEPLVLFPRERGPGLHDMIMRLLRRAGVTPEVRYEVNPMQTVAGLVAAGFGVSVMPASIQRIDVHGVVYRPLPTRHVVDIALTYRTDALSPSLRAFVQTAREIARPRAAR